MNDDNEDRQLRISLDKMANEEGEWLDAPKDEKTVLQTAIFESLFSYVSMATEESKLEVFQVDLSPERIINAMMKRSELDVLDALLKSYTNRFGND
jgi:hypothetical protein